MQIYNDGYWPICGEKHPHAMGTDFSECWASAWPVIGEAFTRALAGETSFLENQRMFLDRNGYLEETFFTFSFSPIRDETGVVGLFHPVTETTSRMLSERRTRALRDLATRTGNAQSADDVCTLAAQTLSDYRLDLPFALFYLFEDESEQARLIASTGLPDGSAASPLLVSLVTPQKFGRGAYAGRDVKDLPAVTLLDINMPKISGLDVLKAIRADERTRHLPVVVLTSSNEDKDRLDAYTHFANSYVIKPVDYDQFVTAASQLGLYWMVLNAPPPRKES